MSDLFQQLLARATSPLVPQIGEGADKAAESITTPSLNESPMMAKLKGFGAGALQGAGHLASDLTSPASIIGSAVGGSGALAGARMLPLRTLLNSGLQGAGNAITAGIK